MDIRIDAANLKKVFNRRVIFRNISLSLTNSQTLLITGRNGSGKSTLAKIICGILTPTEGTLRMVSGANDVTNSLRDMVGFVSPYLQMYDEFSARENVQLALAMRGLPSRDSSVKALLERVSLVGRADDRVGTFSSGMKQRLKYAFALVHQPLILILDEPMANLDVDGIQMVRDIMKDHRERGILIVATNDLQDCDFHTGQVDLSAAH